MAQGHTQPLSWLRPVGWSGDGGVRESNKVELIKSGGGGGGGKVPSLPARGYGGAL